MTETPIPPRQSGAGSNDNLPASRPSGKTLLKILLVIAAICSIPVIIIVIALSSVRW